MAYKIIYNAAVPGGLYLSREAVEWMRGHGCRARIEADEDIPQDVLPRHDNLLAGCIACLGKKANGTAHYFGIKTVADLRINRVDSPFYTIMKDENAFERVIDMSDLSMDASGGKVVADLISAEDFQRRRTVPDHVKDAIWQFDPDNIWFISDTHFGHDRILRYCNRPFVDVNDMNETLIRKWNETVPADGIVFHLGDFGFGNARDTDSILRRLNGTKYLILGNHDMKNVRQSYMVLFAHISQQMTIRVGGQSIILNHNPFLCYGGSYRDTWQLFGHVHSGPMNNTGLDHPRLQHLFPRQYDVGVDNNGFRPVSFAEVKKRIEEQVAAARDAIGISDDDIVIGTRKIVFLDHDAKPVTAAQKVAFNRLRNAVDGIIDLRVPEGKSVKEAIAQRIALLSGKVRYVYLGHRPLDDFRAVRIDGDTGIADADVDTALLILH